MNPETAVTFTCGHFNQVFFAVYGVLVGSCSLTGQPVVVVCRAQLTQSLKPVPLPCQKLASFRRVNDL